MPAVRGRNSATVRPNDANDVLPHSAENGASADTNNSILVKSVKWTVFPDHVTFYQIQKNIFQAVEAAGKLNINVVNCNSVLRVT